MNFKELGENLGLEEDEYMELLELFLETGSADYERIKTAIETKDFDLLIRSAHTIKGASGNLGLMDIHEVAKEVEDIAESKDLSNIDAVVETLGTRIQAIQDCF
jgi:HPt (histidine-containing phosphotransfer) domain-containing protein